MQVKSQAKQLRMTPRKIGLVAGLVRGRTASDSLVILEHTPKRAAQMLADIIKSAIANAEHNHKLAKDNLMVGSIQVGSGGIIKRMKPVAFGRAHPNYHRLSNVTVVLEAKDAEAKTEVKKSEGKK